jgi:hypothetical protein
MMIYVFWWIFTLRFMLLGFVAQEWKNERMREREDERVWKEERERRVESGGRTGPHVFIGVWTEPVHLNQSGSPPNRSLIPFPPSDQLRGDVWGCDAFVLCAYSPLLWSACFKPLDLGFWWSWINPTPLRRLDDPDSSRTLGLGLFFVVISFLPFFYYSNDVFWFLHHCFA